MRCSFVHFGDVHLGTQQYDSPERLNDFGRAWLFACDYIVRNKPDFAICAGDLFNRFTINPVTYDQAFAGLAKLRDAGIPIVDVQGNHDRARFTEAKSWLETFASQGLLTHLDLDIASHGVRAHPVPKGKYSGGFVEWNGCRIFGVRYLGASTERILVELAPELDRLRRDRMFTILVLHAGLEGIVPNLNAELSVTALEQLRERVDYVAMGHIHKHYTVGNLAFNGGSLETWAQNEWGWERGLLHVEVDTSAHPPISFRLIDVPRRPFRILRLDVSQFETPRQLLRECWEMLERERQNPLSEPPVLSLSLTGRLRFDQTDIPINRIEDACREQLQPLTVRIQERYDVRSFVTEGTPDSDDPIDRVTLERDILQARFAEDSRYAARASELARLAIDLKERALRDEDGPSLLDALRATLRSSHEHRDGVTSAPASEGES